MGKITVVGMGPGSFGLISLNAWECMQTAEQLLLRTAKHPTVAELKRRGVSFVSYDELYETAEDFDSLYEKIAADLLLRARQGANLVYAVPGSPLVAERTVVLLREMAMQEKEVELEILPGMSFVEVLYTRLGLDPIQGLTIVDAGDIEALPVDMPTGIIVTQVYNQAIASDTKLSLMERLPDEYELVYVHNLGLPDESVRRLPLYELDRQPDIDHLTSLYLPPMPRAAEFSLSPLVEIMRTLREPGGCPWDREQTHATLRKHLLEEAYEVLEALELRDSELLCEELGDLLLQIVFQARIAEEADEFSMQEVVDGITEKLVRRHPHIFGDVQAADAAAVMVNWEEIKRQEKPERISVLDGVPQGLPALMAAEKLQAKAAKVGFDWDEIGPVWDKCREELQELEEAVAEGGEEHVAEELGDLLFAVVNLARFLGVTPELALLGTNRKFKRRFQVVEQCVRDSAREWQSFSLEELDGFWEQAKRLEREK